MKVGKIAAMTLATTALITAGVKVASTYQSNEAYIRSADTYERQDKNVASGFFQSMSVAKDYLDKEFNALLKQESFSNTKISARADLYDGMITIENCNIRDMIKLRELFQVDQVDDANGDFFLGMGEDRIKACGEDSYDSISFYFDDIKNKKLVHAYNCFNKNIQKRLSKLFNGANIIYNKEEKAYIVKPSTENGVYMKNILPFFTNRFDEFRYFKFQEFNPWAKSLFAPDFKKPLTEEIKIPYSLVTRAWQYN